jgi:hypothetical protein
MTFFVTAIAAPGFDPGVDAGNPGHKRNGQQQGRWY